jgi:hypothetical protein
MRYFLSFSKKIVLLGGLLLSFVAAFGQGGVDTVPMELGLRMLNFELETDNFTGFDDGSEKKLRNAVRDLRDVLPIDSQSLFKGYDLGLYRFTGIDNAKIEADTKKFVADAAANSKFYIVLVKIWSKQQQLEDLRVYFNLPNNLPLFYLTSEKQAQKMAAAFILDEYKARLKNPGQAKKAQASGILRFIEKMDSFEGAEIIDTSNSIQGNIVGVGIERSDSKIYVTPSGDYISIPENSIPTYKKCTGRLVNKGVLISFNIGSLNYNGWYNTETNIFLGYAPKNSVGHIDAEKIYVPEDCTGADRANFGYLEGDSLKQYTGKVSTAVPFDPLNLHPLNRTFVYSDTILVRSDNNLSTGCLCTLDLVLPLYEVKYLPSDVRFGTGTPDPSSTKIDPNAVYGPAPFIIDYTGKPSSFKTAILNILGSNSCGLDILITNTTWVKASAQNLKYINTLRDLHPKFRSILWIHLDEELNEFRYEIILSQQISNTNQGADFNKLFNDFIKKLKPNDPTTGIFGIIRVFLASVGTLQEVLRAHRIPERIFDCSAVDYVLRDISFGEPPKCVSCISDEAFGVQKNPLDNLKYNLAAQAGTLNALNDFVVGTTWLYSLIPKLLFSVFDEDIRSETSKEFGNISTGIDAKLVELGHDANKMRECPNHTLVPYYFEYFTMTAGLSCLTLGEAGGVMSINSVIRNVSSNLGKALSLLKTALGDKLVKYFYKANFIFEESVNGFKITKRIVNYTTGTGIDEVLGLVNEGGQFIVEQSHIVPFNSNWSIIKSFECKGVQTIAGVASEVGLTVFEVSENGVIKTVLCLNAGELVAQIAAKLNLNLAENITALTTVVKNCNTGAWLLDDAVANKVKNLGAAQAKVFVKELGETSGFGLDLAKESAGIVDAWNKLSKFDIRKSSKWLKNISTYLNGNNITIIDFVDEFGNNTLQLKNISGDNVGRIVNERLICTKKASNVVSVVSLGDVITGCQVVLIDGKAFILRVPNKTNFSSNNLSILESGHTLERHGWDVTDEALLLRANKGIAPDGNLTNPPPYSSKFGSKAQLEEALNNSKPGSDNFLNTVAEVNGDKIVKIQSPSGTYFGYGIPKNKNLSDKIFMNNVKAIYKIQPDGSYNLITMYPDVP